LQNFASEPASKVQYFNVTCASGHRVRGERTEGYQALRCPACGDGVFVLPRSPFPEPVAPPRPHSSKSASVGGGWIQEGPVELSDASGVSVEVVDDEASTNGAEIIWDDVADEYLHQPDAPDRHRDLPASSAEEDRSAASAEKASSRAPAGPTPDSRAPRRSRTKPTAKHGPSRERDRTASDAASERDLEARAARNTARGRPKGSSRSPEKMPAAVIEPRRMSGQRALHTLILIAVPLVVVGTIAWRYRQHRRQEYPIIAEEGRQKGIPALDEGNFDKAYQLLSAAKTAVDALGGAVEDAEAIRCAADEAAVFVNLCSRSLEDLLTEAGRTSPETWRSRFDSLYKGQYVILDSHILAEPVPGKSLNFELEYIVFPLGEASSFRRGELARPERIGRIDLTGFRLFESPHRQVGHRVTFGAKLAGFEYDANADQWLIRLDPKSGVYITHTKALETLGWPSLSEPENPLEGQP